MSNITEKVENEILEKLKKTLSSVVSANIVDEYKGTLSKATRLKEDLKMDIVGKGLFTLQVGEDLNMKIPYAREREFETLGDYVDFIYKEEIFGRR